MPRLPSSDPILDTVPSSIDVELPDIPEIAADAGNAPVFGVAVGKYAAMSSEIYQLSSQVTLKNLVVNVGMPVKETFDVIIDALEINVKSEFVDKLKEGGKNLQEAWARIQDGGEKGKALAEVSVDSAIGTAANMSAIIPVAGWVVKVLWSVAKAIRGIVKLVKESTPEHAKALYPPSTFNPRLDKDTVNAVLDDVRYKRDWGRRWGPPAMGKGIGTTPDFNFRELEGGGAEIIRKVGQEDGEPINWGAAGWLGMIPGTPYLHQGVQLSPSGALRDVGEILLPSSRQILLWLWGNIIGHGTKVTPSLWCVDSNDLDFWGQYILDLHTFVAETDRLTTKQKQRIIDFYNVRGGQRVFGWGSSIKVKENEWDDYEPLQQAQDLRARQMGYLDTIMVAYVNDSFEAIKRDPEMKDKWHMRRMQLLEHPARCDVDLSNIPAGDPYRDALIESGATSGLCHAAAIGNLALAPGFSGPEVAVPTGTTYAVPTKPRRRARRISPMVPFVGLSAAAFWAWKTGKLSSLRLPRL